MSGIKEMNRFNIFFDDEVIGKQAHRLTDNETRTIIGFKKYFINDIVFIPQVILEDGYPEFIDNIDWVG